MRALPILGLLTGAYGLFLRPRLLRWGATDAEVAAPSPGEAIIPGATLVSTMATTIDAPPLEVWRWLAQMGYDRGGWYSWDSLDHEGIPSARIIHPEWQSLSVGQRLKATRDGRFGFEVAAVEPGRFLALRAAMTGRRQYDSTEPRPRFFSDSLWEFSLGALRGGRTRLVVRTRGVSRPKLLNALLGFVFWEPAHFVMQARQFANLKARTEWRRQPAGTRRLQPQS